ncbi:hypothetical protein [Rhizobium leucaenae]|uniref:Lipoprotein n=1 Tax=Rhizobium leucaenae TaxID=29450 RepID=A0A7W6ZZ55_9HYPH|nr:hypothetical protein [Rhizobium leucaenae]MBB4571391.1 hypothetical protein [Rhizobium leucaenae]
MKHQYAINKNGKITTIGLALTVALAGCTTSSPQSTSAAAAPAGKTDVAINAFKKLCLQTAPDFAAGIQGAKRYGVTFLDLGGEQSGMTKDESMSVQIKPGKECAITSPNRADTTLHQQFLRTVAEFADKVPQDDKPNQPFIATIKGRRFIFQHDRKGGEAYVMLNLEK